MALSPLEEAQAKYEQIQKNIWYKRLTRWRIHDIVTLLVLIVVYHYSNLMKPFEREFIVNDIRFAHPFTVNETVTNNELFIYAYWIPFAIFFLGVADIYATLINLLGLTFSIVLTLIITNILKNNIGNLRPDFLLRCVPLASTPINTLVSIDVCTTKNLHRLLDGFRSTPSGHSSLSFSGLFYLTLYLAELLDIFASNGFWRVLVAISPTLGAALVATSRLQDYRHHYFDVISGSLLGAIIAYAVFSKYTKVNKETEKEEYTEFEQQV